MNRDEIYQIILNNQKPFLDKDEIERLRSNSEEETAKILFTIMNKYELPAKGRAFYGLINLSESIRRRFMSYALDNYADFRLVTVVRQFNHAEYGFYRKKIWQAADRLAFNDIESFLSVAAVMREFGNLQDAAYLYRKSQTISGQDFEGRDVKYVIIGLAESIMNSE